MTGRTNAGGGGGGGSAFLAYLQVATDPNAEITAVNLAGDTFSGTANSTGALVLNITEPGTYTVTETNGGVETIVIADNGETYQLTVNSFDGLFIVDGVAVVDGGFTAEAYAYGSYAGQIPTVTSYTDTRGRYIINVSVNGGKSGMYLATTARSIASFTSIDLIAYSSQANAVKVVAVDENDNVNELAVLGNSDYQPLLTVPLSGLDITKKYRFGVWCAYQYASDARINKMVLV